MPPYFFQLPTTSLLTFSNILVDPSGSYTAVLAEATTARTSLYLALKSLADGDAGASALSVLDAVQVYLPYLRGIIACLDADELLYKGEPVVQWRSPLTHYTMSPPLLSLPSIHSEHLFVILTYTLALSNYAHSILASLPIFEPKAGTSSSASSHISAEDEKRSTAGLSRAVDLLCQASGVAEWAANNVCAAVEPVRMTSAGRLGKGRWPIEIGRETFRGLAMLLLADAHLTAIRKLLLPVLPHALFAPPGPPLPSNHPSPSLLAKLYLHVSSLYDSARASLKVHQSDSTSSSSSTSRKLFKSDKSSELSESDTVEGEVIPALKRYLRKESALALALAQKWLGADAGENGKGAKVGEALAWVKDAEKRLEEMEDGKVREKMKGLSGIGKGSERKKEERKARKGRVERELDDIRAWVRAYSRLNDTVAFQPVPPVSSLITPSGRPIFAAKPFIPPNRKFEPIRRHNLAPGEDNGDGDGEEADVQAADAGSEPANYAGKGNYF